MTTTQWPSVARPIRPVTDPPAGRASRAELAALHTHLVLQLQIMVEDHRRGCAFVSAYPNPHDTTPNEIVVVPFSSGAALFSVGFTVGPEITTLAVRIGDHGLVECADTDHAVHSFAGTAEWLFGLALRGRYREDTWWQTATGRVAGTWSYVLDETERWRELDLPGAARPPELGVSLQQRRYEPY